MEASSKTVITVSLIGLAGTLGAAVISNWDRIFHQTQATISSPPLVAPHAPAIEENTQEYTLWGEETKLLALGPGEKTVLKGMDLYSSRPTYPEGGCAGNTIVFYTWQVREPYPQGGDLEIRSMVQGGREDQVGLGAMGKGAMTPCGEHIFQNNGLQPMKIEVRYTSGFYKAP